VVREAALSRGGNAEWAHDLVLAVDEACQNVVRHGYAEAGLTGDLLVEVAADPEGLCVHVTDFAKPLDPATIRSRDLNDVRPGGLGVFLMRTLTDECVWEPPPPGAGNVLRLRKLLPAEAPHEEKGERP
jgi:anti-sigma regulatory factor (Ser/Thr protein kinase)